MPTLCRADLKSGVPRGNIDAHRVSANDVYVCDACVCGGRIRVHDAQVRANHHCRVELAVTYRHLWTDYRAYSYRPADSWELQVGYFAYYPACHLACLEAYLLEAYLRVAYLRVAYLPVAYHLAYLEACPPVAYFPA